MHPYCRRLFGAWVATALSTLAAETPRLLPFQARLTDKSGQSLPDGTTVVQFQLFAVPTGGTPVWAGELHRLTVSGGLVNVLLGSKNPLPLNYPGDDSRPFFASTLYLQATPDSNGDGKITNDPPLEPRQAVLPVVFAAESAVSRTSLDSAKLAGKDWSAILKNGSTDPTTGSLDGAKLAPGSVDGSRISPASIQTAQLATGAVDARTLGTGVVTAVNLAPASIPMAKLAPRQISANGAAGDIAISPPNLPSNPGNVRQGFRHLSESITQVPGLEVSLVTTGRPVLLTLLPDNVTEDKTVAPSGDEYWDTSCIWINTGPGGAYGLVYFVVDGHQKAAIPLRAGVSEHVLVQPSAVSQVLPLAAGNHTFKVHVAYRGPSSMEIHTVRLMVCEL